MADGLADDLPPAVRLVQELEDQLGAELRAVEPPQPLPPPASRSGRCLRALAALGGVASARAIALHLSEPGVGARQVRESLRGHRLRRLGAGFLALPDAVEPDLGPWLRARLRRLGARRVDDLVVDILARWPHGDAGSVRGWLLRDPPGVVVVDGVARLAPDWRESAGGG